MPTDSGLPASSANHSLPLAFFSATCGQLSGLGWEILIFKAEQSECSCFKGHAALVCGQGGGLSTQDGHLSSFMPLATAGSSLLGQRCCSLSSSGPWQWAHGCQEQLGRWVWELCCPPPSLGPTASKHCRQLRGTKCSPSWTYRPRDLWPSTADAWGAMDAMLLPEQI